MRTRGGSVGAMSPFRRKMSRAGFLKLGGTGLAGAAMLGGGTLAGCGVFEQQAGQGGGESPRSIVFNLDDTIRDLNSTTTTDAVSTDVLLNVMAGLYRLDHDTRPVPDLAEGVKISADKLNYTFTLREGIEWSNGDPVVAEDFRYAWLRALDPDTAGQYAYIIGSFIDGGNAFNAGEGSEADVAVSAPDERTLEVTLAAPSPFWLGLTAFYTYLPLNRRFVEEQGDEYAQSADGLLYNGPYTLTEFDSTTGVTMVKNDRYWNRANVDVSRVEGRIVKELDTAVTLYENGELDVQSIDGEYVDEFRDSPEYHTTTFFATFYMVGNQALDLFKNQNIRKAIQIGYDRKAMCDQILKNGSPPATGYIPDGLAGPGDQTFREALGPTQPEFDATEARRLFQQGIEELGENPTIELLAYDDSSARDIATFLQAQFSENLGAEIEVRVQPFDRKLELEENGEFQLSWQAWIADYDDPMTFLELFESSNAFNTYEYTNTRYDDLVSGAREELDEGRRMDMMLEAERILVEETAGCAPMYFQGQARLQRPSITRFVWQPYGGGRDISLWKVKG